MKKNILFLFLLFWATVSTSYGQPPYPACFTLDSDSGCAPFTVTATNCSPSLVPSPVYNFEYPKPPKDPLNIQNPIYTYTTPGTYTVRQEVNDGISAISYTTRTVVVLGKPDPIYNVQICLGQTIHLNITDTNYNTFLIDFGDGSTALGIKAIYNHVYLSTAPVTITVTGSYTRSPPMATICTGASASKTITPINTLVRPDIIDLTVVSQSSSSPIDIRFSAIIDRIYKIEYKINNGLYTPFTTVTATTSGIMIHRIEGLNTQSNTYTFRIQNIDPCLNTSASSAEIPSIILTTTLLSGTNRIAFQSNGGLVFSTTDLNRDGTLLQSNPASPYNDTNILCGTDYCYQVEGTLPTTSVTTGLKNKSYSIASCLKAIYTGTAPVAANLNATVEGTKVKVVWDTPALNPAVPAVSFYTIFREDGSAYVNYGSATSNLYEDNNVVTNQQPYCYKISYKDACNNTSLLSENTCSVMLSLTRTDEISNLFWTPYVGYKSGIKEYILENLDENENVVLSKSVGLNTSISELADQTLSQIIYRIKVVSIGIENLISYSNIVRLDLTPQVYMPTVFTPNGDGNNDILEIKGKYYKSAKMTILNKWGETVFSSEDASIGWDGNYRGQPAAIDAYGYHIVALDNQGNEISLKGTVSLVR